MVVPIEIVLKQLYNRVSTARASLFIYATQIPYLSSPATDIVVWSTHAFHLPSTTTLAYPDFPLFLFHLFPLDSLVIRSKTVSRFFRPRLLLVHFLSHNPIRHDYTTRRPPPVCVLIDFIFNFLFLIQQPPPTIGSVVFVSAGYLTDTHANNLTDRRANEIHRSYRVFSTSVLPDVSTLGTTRRCKTASAIRV